MSGRSEGPGIPAILMDGKGRQRRQVELFPAPDGLGLVRDDEGEEDLPWEALILVDDAPDRTVLGRKGAPDWRLVVAPPLAAAIRADLRRRRAQARRRRGLRVYGSTVAGLAMVAALLWFRGGALLEQAAPLVPPALTVPLGQAIAESVTGGKPCRGAAAEAALERLVGRLLPRGSPAEPIRVQVADIPQANALAAPGGQVVLTRGLIEQASGPDEVAGVLAHELGHVAHRHATRMILRDLGVGVLLGRFGGDAAALADTLLATSMSRDMEREADAFAIAALAAARISPAGLVAFFEREGAPEAPLGQAGRWLSTHPSTPERLLRFRAAAARARGTSPAMTQAEWAALKRVCGPLSPRPRAPKSEMRGKDPPN